MRVCARVCSRWVLYISFCLPCFQPSSLQPSSLCFQPSSLNPSIPPLPLNPTLLPPHTRTRTGTLIVRAVPGANVHLRGLVVKNKGWAIEPLKVCSSSLSSAPCFSLLPPPLQLSRRCRDAVPNLSNPPPTPSPSLPLSLRR